MPVLGVDEISRQHLQSVGTLVSPRPKSVLVVTAHWEADPIRVSAHAAPDLLFGAAVVSHAGLSPYADYYGFPEETYTYKYPAPGSPELAKRVKELLNAKGVACEFDSQRGLDHGVFVPSSVNRFFQVDLLSDFVQVPMMLAYKEADIPVVAMSIHASLNPVLHLKLGEALKPLRDEGVLILASGMSFHNMRAFRFQGRDGPPVGSAFDEDLGRVVLDTNVAERNEKLRNWTMSLRDARHAHPREEHFIPLLVAAGAAGIEDRVSRIFRNVVLGAQVSAFAFGLEPEPCLASSA